MPQNQVLIAASHGTDSALGSAAISSLVAAVRNRLGARVETLETYVDVQHPQVDEVLASASESHPGAVLTVVPLLLSTGYHVRQDIADAAFDNQSEVFISPALGPDARLVEVLARRLEEAGADSTDRIILVAAGSSDPRAVSEVVQVSQILENRLSLKWKTSVGVQRAYLSAAEPKLQDLIPELRAKNPNQRLVVATYLLAPGFFAEKAKQASADLVSEPLLAANQATPEELVEIVIDRFENAQDRSGRTGCLEGLRGDQWQGCAAGCLVACRKPKAS